MSKAFITKLQQLTNCDPNKCIKEQCPIYNPDEDKCMYENVLNTFTIIMQEKFKERNKE